MARRGMEVVYPVLQLRPKWSYTEFRLFRSQFKDIALSAAFGVRRLSVLSELHVGESGVLVALDLPESVQNHLMHMGFVPDAHVTALRRAPAGDPRFTALTAWRLPCGSRRQKRSACAILTQNCTRKRFRSSLRLRDECLL